MDFGEVLGKAWRIVWKHKVLWIFGIFAGCSSGGGGGGGGGSSSWQQSADSGQASGPEIGSQIEQAFQQAAQWISDNLWIFLVLGLLVLIIALIGMFLGTIGKIGLIRGAFRADSGEEKLQFGELFRGSLPYFWRVFLLSFLIGLAALLIFLPLTIFGVVTAGIGFLCIVPLLCVLVPVLFAVGIVVQQADAAMVIEDLSMMDGVRRAWGIVKKNVGPVLLIWLITAVIGGVIGFVLALPFLVTVIPAVIALAASPNEFPTAIVTVAGLCFVLYIPVLIVAQGILTSYVESVWALTFLRLTRPPEGKGALESPPANA
jgi:hypothetical protein